MKKILIRMGGMDWWGYEEDVNIKVNDGSKEDTKAFLKLLSNEALEAIQNKSIKIENYELSEILKQEILSRNNKK